MSVVEKPAPRWRIVAIVVGVVTALVAAVAIVSTIADGSSRPADRSAEPSSTTAPSSSAASARVTTPARVVPIDLRFDRGGGNYRIYLHRTGAANTIYVFAYIDVARGELTYVDQNQIVYGSVVGRVGDRVVVEGASVRIIDKDFAGPAVSIGSDDFVGIWRDHVIAAEYFPERTTFHEYRLDGSEARSVGMVGRRPDVVGGVVRDSVIVERTGRLLRLGLDDASVREFGIGHLLGVGGDRIFFTSCTTQGACTLNEATLEGTVRTTPIGKYIDPDYGGIFSGKVAPDGSAILVHDHEAGAESVLERGVNTVLLSEIESRLYAWAPTGGWLFRVDDTTKKLEAVGYRNREVVPVPLPKDDTVSLRSVAVW
jgi:hypothetical protein